MAKRAKTLPARRHNATSDSLLIRSAESLGRIIGLLQRQLNAALMSTDEKLLPGEVDAAQWAWHTAVQPQANSLLYRASVGLRWSSDKYNAVVAVAATLARLAQHQSVELEDAKSALQSCDGL